MKLGAKWVEVRKRRDQTESKLMMKSEFETWPATPVEASLEINELPLLWHPAGVASFLNKWSSRGRPAIRQSRSPKSVQNFLELTLASEISGFKYDLRRNDTHAFTVIDDVLPTSLRVTVDEHLEPVSGLSRTRSGSLAQSAVACDTYSTGGANRSGGIDQCRIADRSSGSTSVT